MCSQSSWAFFSSAKDLFFLQIWLRFLILPTVQCWGLSCPDCKWADYRRTGGVIQPLRGLQREDVKNNNKFLEILFNFNKKCEIFGTGKLYEIILFHNWRGSNIYDSNHYKFNLPKIPEEQILSTKPFVDIVKVFF